jgi:plastocyanin
MHARSLIGLAIVACGALACGGGGGGGGSSNLPTTPQTPSTPVTPVTPASPSDVIVENNDFNPATITVPAGTTVKWTWSTCGGSDPYAGTTCVNHSVTWDVAATDSPTQSQGTYQRAFATAGTYTYHCVMHGAAMSGKVVVQ